MKKGKWQARPHQKKECHEKRQKRKEEEAEKREPQKC